MKFIEKTFTEALPHIHFVFEYGKLSHAKVDGFTNKSDLNTIRLMLAQVDEDLYLADKDEFTSLEGELNTLNNRLNSNFERLISDKDFVSETCDRLAKIFKERGVSTKIILDFSFGGLR